MEFRVKSGKPEKQRSACLVVGVYEARKLTPAAQAVNEAGKKHLAGLLRKGGLDGAVGQSLLLPDVPGVMAERLLLVGCGKRQELDGARFQEIIANSARQLRAAGVVEAVSFLPELDVKGRDEPWKVRQAVCAMEHALYRFREFKSDDKPDKKTPRRITLSIPSRRGLAAAEVALNQGMALAAGVKLTRDLGNLPANVCTPAYLAERAAALGNSLGSVSVEVLDEPEMKKLGMNSLLSVTQGSDQPAKLIAFQYQGADRALPPVALVGKGVTFDTGGISLKPPAAMDEMKFDMCGAATVFGVVRAVAGMKLPVNLVGVAPAVENMPGGDATRPGDIYTSMSGKTVEVLNTDAEGRLILCDALTYSAKFKPAVVIDVATLTGACVIALGKHASGLLSNDDPLADELLRAGDTAGDRAWRLPLWKEYEKQLDSPFADMANVGGRDAGTITAACFLSKFTRDYRWAHLDIAGTAWISGKQKGATGRPVPLLVHYLLDRHARQG